MLYIYSRNNVHILSIANYCLKFQLNRKKYDTANLKSVNENCHQWIPVGFCVTQDYNLNKAKVFCFFSSDNILQIEYC